METCVDMELIYRTDLVFRITHKYKIQRYRLLKQMVRIINIPI
jgi:hypothetical protein